MAVNSFIAGMLYDRFFRGLLYDSVARQYRFSTVQVTDHMINNLIQECDRFGHIVYKEEIQKFLDSIVNDNGDLEEWRYIPLNLVCNGEILYIRGVSGRGRMEIRIMRLTDQHWLVANSNADRQWKSCGILELPSDLELVCDTVVSIGELEVTPKFISVERPTLFYRLIDRVALGPSYAENVPARLLPLYNKLSEMHRKGTLCQSQALLFQWAAECGISIYSLKKMLENICLS